MKIIFWQNIVSPHLALLYSSLAEKYEVILIVNTLLSVEREKQGWSIPVIENVQIIEIMDNNHISELVHLYNNEKNVFGGLAFMQKNNLQFAYKSIIKFTKVVVISEAPIQMGFQKYVKFLLYKLYFLKYKQSISHIFAMGDIGVNWFSMLGFPREKITEFMYFIDYNNTLINAEKKDDRTQFVFIGQLIHRKGCDNLLRALSNIDNDKWSLTIIGTGVEKNNLEKLTSKFGIQNNIKFKNTIPNSKIKSEIVKSDYLLLPSRFDGWGAVVSEALSVGIPVICSDKCGSNVMISGNNGFVFKEGNHSDLVQTLRTAIENKNYSKENIFQSFQKTTVTKIEEFSNIINTL